MEISPVSFSHNRGNARDFQRGCGCVLCLVWSRGLTALALILWRPSLPQRAELLIKKPSAQTEPFHLEPWHPWQSLCLFIAVLLAFRSQFCLKATWIPLKRTIDECYRCGLDRPRSDLNIETISTDRMSLKQGIWIYLWPSVWFVSHPFKTDLEHTLSRTSPVFVPFEIQMSDLNVLFLVWKECKILDSKAARYRKYKTCYCFFAVHIVIWNNAGILTKLLK